MILLIITNAGGAAFFKTFFKKLPFTLSWFGSSANTKDGIPMVKTLVSVSWIGMKGYGISIKRKIKANKPA